MTRYYYIFRIIIISILCCYASDVLATEIKENQIELSFKEATDFLAKGEFQKSKELYEGVICRENLKDTTVLMRELQGISLTRLVFCYMYLNQPNEALAYLEKLSEDNKFWIAKNSPRDIGAAKAYLQYMMGQYEAAVGTIGEVLEQDDAGRPDKLLSFDYAVAFTIYSYDSEYVKLALDFGVKAADLLKKTMHDPAMLGSILANLIWQSQQAGELEKALEYYNSLEEYSLLKPQSQARSMAETAMVEVYSEWGLEEETDKHMDVALDIADGNVVVETIVRTYSVLTLQNLLRGKLDEARISLDSTKHYNAKVNISAYGDVIKKYELTLILLSQDSLTKKESQQINTLMGRWEKESLNYTDIRIAWMLSNSLIEKGEKKLAREMLEKTLRHVKDNYSLRHSKDIYQSLASLYADEGRHELSQEYYEKASKTNELFVKRRNAQILNQFRVEQEVKELEKEVANISNFWKIILCVLTSCFIFIIIYIIYRYIKKGKVHRKEIAKFTIKRKTQEIINQATTFSTEEDVQKFKKQFAEHHPDFIHNLREHSPKISNNDELLCMLIKQNLSVHEIAIALGVKTESIHTSRSRLKRKLNLEKNIQLDEWIQSR